MTYATLLGGWPFHLLIEDIRGVQKCRALQPDIHESGLNKIAEYTPADVCAIFIPKKTTSDDVLKLLQKEYGQ